MTPPTLSFHTYLVFGQGGRRGEVPLSTRFRRPLLHIGRDLLCLQKVEQRCHT